MNKFLQVIASLVLVLVCRTHFAWASQTGASQYRIGRIQLELEEQLGAKKYEIELREIAGKVPVKSVSAAKPNFELSLPVGKYKMRARVFDLRGIAGPWSKEESVVVTPFAKEKLPAPNIVTLEKVNPQKVVWSSPQDMEVYINIYYRRFGTEQVWQKVLSLKQVASEVSLQELTEVGEYRIDLAIEDEIFGESATKSDIFIRKPSRKDLAEIDQQIGKY